MVEGTHAFTLGKLSGLFSEGSGGCEGSEEGEELDSHVDDEIVQASEGGR